jgi:hypothetical protein
VFFHYAETAPAQSPTQILQKKARNRWNLLPVLTTFRLDQAAYYQEQEGRRPALSKLTLVRSQLFAEHDPDAIVYAGRRRFSEGHRTEKRSRLLVVQFSISESQSQPAMAKLDDLPSVERRSGE